MTLIKDQETAFYAQPTSTVIDQLQSHGEVGLSAEAVAQRYETYGWNELTFKPRRPAWVSFLLQFNQPLLYILLFAGG